MTDRFTEQQDQQLRSIGGYVVLGMAILAAILGGTAGAQDYSVYTSWDAMDNSPDAKYANVTRVSGTVGYTGFWFFGAEQFDATNRYALAMTVYFKDRDVRQDDVADIGYFDLQNGNTWTIANDPLGFGLGTSGAASSFGGHTTVTLEGHGFSSETEYNFVMNEVGLPGLVLWVSFTGLLLWLGTTRLRLIEDVETRVDLGAICAVIVGLTITGFAGAFSAGQGAGPYFWFAAGVLAYWFVGPGLRTRSAPAPGAPLVAAGGAS